MEQEIDGEFISLIDDVYCIESRVEFFNSVIASNKVTNEKYKEVINRLINDSNIHIGMVEELISSIGFLNIERIRQDTAVLNFYLDFDMMSEDEIMRKLLEFEHKAHDCYQKIYELSDRNMLEQAWKGDNIVDFCY